jgi:hypothetical protein
MFCVSLRKIHQLVKKKGFVNLGVMGNKMKNLILTYLLTTITVLCLAQTNTSECDKFKTGTFTYKEESFNTVIITRTKKKQKEHDTKSGLKINFKIHWTGDCEYELILVWSNDKEIDKRNGSIIKVKVINIFSDSYEYTADYNGNTTEYTVVRMGK